MARPIHKFGSIVLIICFSVSVSGCVTLKPREFDQFGYQGEAMVKKGSRMAIVDWMGNLLGGLEKLVLWTTRAKRHNITDPKTEDVIQGYITDHAGELGDLLVNLNRYAPGEAWSRLVKNNKVGAPYRFTFGVLSVLLFDTLLVDRIFGSDRYNPYTHTVHLHSDHPSIALLQMAHAGDFARQRYRGTYALVDWIPGLHLVHQSVATIDAIAYAKEASFYEAEVEAYETLYPFYGTTLGQFSMMGLGIFPVGMLAHIPGRFEAEQRRHRIKQDHDVVVA